ncbi:hypothetical protein [Streptomyces avidinii]|uniref:Uncharacterized protein n=1 Tax=Streptomyces avidinii TaxID=1895 RepID=A0ABS4LFS1_STRAV|nr:hypothetical protein [Streptomyces avidinii]MBP2040976.1 hypothetical protein [Streptomyces avidinii]
MRHAEAVIVERYPQLVRPAYLSLPTSLDRHSRVLRAHRAVQQALRSGGRGNHGTGTGGEDRPDLHSHVAGVDAGPHHRPCGHRGDQVADQTALSMGASPSSKIPKAPSLTKTGAWWIVITAPRLVRRSRCQAR